MSVPSVTKDDIFLAILAMDTYHRGVNSGLGETNVGLGFALGTQIGEATIAAYENKDASIGFVAFRYSWDVGGGGQNIKTVYAYRGTDRTFSLNFSRA